MNLTFKLFLFSLLAFFAVGVSFADEHGHAAPAAADAKHVEKSGGHEEGGIGGKLVHILEHHLVDSEHFEFLGFSFHLHPIKIGSLEIKLTKHRIWWVIALLLVFFLVSKAARQKTAVPTGMRNVFEVMAVFVRDEVVKPNLHEKTEKFLPYFLTLFTCILFSNLLGLFPWGASATGNVNVTAGLALCTLGMMVGLGVKENGIGGFLHSFVPGGVPLWLLPLIIIIEIVSFFIRPFALTIRLFANMLAGHAVIAVLLGLIVSLWFAVPSVAVSTGVMVLEIIVALIQSYIFIMLTAVFVGLTMHPSH